MARTTALRAAVARLLPGVLALAIAAATIALASDRLVTEPVASSPGALPATVTLEAGATALPFNVAGMVPGDTAGPKQLTVSNPGATPWRYGVSSTTTEDRLAAQLDLWVWLEADEADTASLGLASDKDTCEATPGSGIETYLYEQGPVGSTATTALVGDPTQPYPGDRLLAADDEVLCLYVELPRSTGNEYQGLETTAEFTVHAEQTPLD